MIPFACSFHLVQNGGTTRFCKRAINLACKRAVDLKVSRFDSSLVVSTMTDGCVMQGWLAWCAWRVSKMHRFFDKLPSQFASEVLVTRRP